VATQLRLFEESDLIQQVGLDSSLWQGSFNGSESSLHQLSPYVGKLKSEMVNVLLTLYSKPGEVVLDPFCGSGVVPLEALLSGRTAYANDLSPYAHALTQAKVEAPAHKSDALDATYRLIDKVVLEAPKIDLASVPDWVREFFHPKTLQEVMAAFVFLRDEPHPFLTGCLLGILHHVRPGFLSYPASHLVPYLRKAKYPPEVYPEMYEYRDLRSRLLAKVERAYRRAHLPAEWDQRQYRLWQINAMSLPIDNETVDAVVSSPPYFGALDYARDNRLRLWFLGCHDWRELDKSLTASFKVYLPQMAVCLQELCRVLKPGKLCVLVLGDVMRNGETKRTAEILSELAGEVTAGGFTTEQIYDDVIPDERRSRRMTRTTKFERILILRKN